MEILNRIPKKNKHLAWRIVDQEAVIINLKKQPNDKEEIIILNPTATRIWQLCNGRNSIKEIVQRLKAEYLEVIEKDVEKTLINLLNEKLISL